MPQPQPQYSQGQLDAIARQRGFHDYATWSAWDANRQANLRPAAPDPSQQPNFLQSLVNKIPIHPSYLFNYVNDKIKSATGN